MTSTPETIDRARIEALIPHAGAMCLLERVVAWDADSIECATESHRWPQNPLRVDGRVPVEAGIEYAAQAMAVHGGLRAGEGEPPRRGFVAVVNRVSWSDEWLDEGAPELRVGAVALQGDADRRQYRFWVDADDRRLVEGEALVVLEEQA